MTVMTVAIKVLVMMMWRLMIVKMIMVTPAMVAHLSLQAVVLSTFFCNNLW